MKTTQTWKIGDCLQLLPEIPDKSIDLILTDLPYGTTDCKWDTVIPIEALWYQYRRIISDVGTVVLFGNNKFSFKVTYPALDIFKYKWVWIKTNSTLFTHSKNRPLVKHEDILIFSHGSMGHRSLLGTKRMTYNPQDLLPFNKMIKKGNGRFGKLIGNRPSHKDEILREFTNYPCDVLECQEDIGITKIHTSQKPLELIEYLIKTYTNEGDTVHDSCLGSGTTLEACANLNRNCIGFELLHDWEEHYRKRLKLDNTKLDAWTT